MAALPLRGAALAAAVLLAACATTEAPVHTHHATSRRPVEAPALPEGATATVHRGDTLYSIAFRNNLDFRRLAAWNNIGPDYRIYPGRRLRLTPAGGGQAYLSPPASAALSPPRAASQLPLTLPPTPPRAGAAGPPARVALAPVPSLRAFIPANPNADAIMPGEMSAQAGPAPEATSWIWPTDGHVVRNFAPADGSKGVDISAPVGQMVVAAAPGKVVYSGSALKGYGELVIVKHGERYLSAYGYNRKRLVEEGEIVKQGQPLAELGTGPAQQPELHFEIREEGQPIDPLGLLPRRGG